MDYFCPEVKPTKKLWGIYSHSSLPSVHCAGMSVRLILHTVIFLLNEGVRADSSLTNYQDLFLSSVFCVSLGISGFPVIHVYSDSEKNSHPKCDNDFVTFLTSKGQGLDDDNTEFKLAGTTDSDGETVIQDEKRRIERQETTVVPQVNIRLLNTRIQTGLVVLKSHRHLKTAYSSTLVENVEKKRVTKYPLTVINVSVPQHVALTRFQKDPPVLESQRTKKSGVAKTLQKTYGNDLAALPWNTLWIIQEFRALKVPQNYLYKKSRGPEDSETSKHEVKERSEDPDLAVVPWQTLWLLQSERTECSFPGKVLRIGSSLKDIEMNEWLRPNPKESLGNCPVRFRPLVDPYRWLPRNLVSKL